MQAMDGISIFFLLITRVLLKCDIWALKLNYLFNLEVNLNNLSPFGVEKKKNHCIPRNRVCNLHRQVKSPFLFAFIMPVCAMTKIQPAYSWHTFYPLNQSCLRHQPALTSTFAISSFSSLCIIHTLVLCWTSRAKTFTAEFTTSFIALLFFFLLGMSFEVQWKGNLNAYLPISVI